MRYMLSIISGVLIITLAFGGLVTAESGSLMYRKYYNLDGSILMKIQAGSDYDSTGQHKAMVRGIGSLERDEYIIMGKEGMSVSNNSSWTADPNSLRGLEVAGTFRLHDQYEGDSKYDGKTVRSDSEQIFAVSVDANPGEKGSLSQGISAASSVYGNDDYMFAIDQSLSTSDGTVKRFIDITDPATGAYLFEDAEIRGKVDISEELRSTGNDGKFTLFEDTFKDEVTEEQNGVDTTGKDSIDSFLENDEKAVIIDGAEIFKSVVQLGTELDQLGLDQEIIFQSDLMLIKDIFVKWEDHLFGQYNPNEVGSYTFAGELIFPDTVASDEKVYIFHVVHVVEDVEEFKSNQLENLVHGGENGKDEYTDE